MRRCLSFWERLVSLFSILRVHPCVRTSFLFKGWIVFCCLNGPPFAYPFIPPWTLGYNAAISTWVSKHLDPGFSSEHVLRSSGSYGALCLVFVDPSCGFHSGCALARSTSSAQRFQSLHILPSAHSLLLPPCPSSSLYVDSAHLNGCEVTSLNGFNFHFSNN